MNDASPITPILPVSEDVPALGLESELLDSIGEILEALAAVTHGDLARRLEPRYEDTHPVGALALSVNAMAEALTEAKARSSNYELELEVRLRAIEQQRLAINELSTPVIEVWEGVLCVPVIGTMDSMRMAEMTSTLLEAIANKHARCAILDITGIEVMDTRVVDHFMRTAGAVQLLGARCVLSGVHPNISQTIVNAGLEMHGFETHRTLRDALKNYVLRSQRTIARAGSQPSRRGERRPDRVEEERK